MKGVEHALNTCLLYTSETQALIELLAEEFPEAEAYMSFTVQIPDAISDGTSLAEMAKLVSQSNQILAVGINCSSPLLYNQAPVSYTHLYDVSFYSSL